MEAACWLCGELSSAHLQPSVKMSLTSRAAFSTPFVCVLLHLRVCAAFAASCHYVIQNHFST